MNNNMMNTPLIFNENWTGWKRAKRKERKNKTLPTDLIGRIIRFIPMNSYIGYDYEALKKQGLEKRFGSMNFQQSSQFWGKKKYNFETATVVIKILCKNMFRDRIIDEKMLGFGKHKREEYSRLRLKDIGYCKWIKQLPNAKGKVLEFQQYLLDKEPEGFDFDD